MTGRLQDARAEAAPLEGLRVIDLSTFVAGPSCSGTLARLGAEVVRIDPIGGAADHTRLPLDSDGESLYWRGLNDRKRSVEVDLKSAEGRELVGRLVALPGADCGVVLSNAVGQSWLGYEQLCRYRQDLIMAHISGHPDGRPAVDYTVNCEVGLPAITGPAEQVGVTNHVLPAWDLLTGLYAAIGILAAKRVRDETGAGQMISISLADVAVATMDQLGFIADVVRNGRRRGHDGNHVFGAFGGDFETGDGERVMVTALTARQWRRLVAATQTAKGVEGLETGLGIDFDDDAARYEHRDLLGALIRPWFAARPLGEVAEQLDREGVLWGRYRTVEQLVHDGDSLLNRPADEAVPAPAPPPLRFSASQLAPARAAQLGRETDEILGALLDLGRDELSGLRSAGVIGGEPAKLAGWEAA